MTDTTKQPSAVRSRDEQGWQPIETAPTGEELFLVWLPEHGMEAVVKGSIFASMAKQDTSSHLRMNATHWRYSYGPESEQEDYDAALEQVIIERDEAEEFLTKVCEEVLGRDVEWSNGYGYQSALNDVSEHMHIIETEQRASMEKSGAPVCWVPKFDLDMFNGEGPENPYDALESTLHRKNDNATLVPLYTAPQPDAQAEKVARLEAENTRLREALNSLYFVSKRVWTLGAQTGRQWVDLGIEVTRVQAALASDQKESGEISHD
ncbi:hypothetical protein [Kozakia baliensis]|uniref:hypothetical protein n=1 Tax=Kozakia baliensis TaxID=153496 RepID=UPI0004966398|nr:hypothetical protein [Kozakia baliensis]